MRLASEAIGSTVARHALDRGEVRPTADRREGLELVVEKDRIALLPRFALERQGDEVPETAARHRVLVGEQAVVGVHGELMAAGHGLGDEVAAHPARRRRGDGSREEEPDVGAVARAERSTAAGTPRRGRSRRMPYVLPPGALVEVGGQKPAGLVG